MEQIRTNSWDELISLLYAGAWQAELRRFRSTSAFRGMSDAGFDLHSSLIRLNANPAQLERHPLRNFRKYARYHTRVDDSIWSWLALAQHHDLPTRMLDWTYWPFVALHFATLGHAQRERDGVVWCVDYIAARECLPEPLRQALRAEEAGVFTTDILDRAVASLDELGRLSEEPYVLFFEPPSIDDRIVNQMALFACMSRPDAALDDWLVRRPHLCRRVIIPARLKDEVRDKLDQANITERVLFPGLDGLCSWLARYSPRAG